MEEVRDAYGWTTRVERYFDLKGMYGEEKLQAVMVAMEGKALTRYQWWEFSAHHPNWEDFWTAVIRRFQPTMVDSPFELLLSLKQIGSVEEYVEASFMMMNQVDSRSFDSDKDVEKKPKE